MQRQPGCTGNIDRPSLQSRHRRSLPLAVKQEGYAHSFTVLRKCATNEIGAMPVDLFLNRWDGGGAVWGCGRQAAAA